MKVWLNRGIAQLVEQRSPKPRAVSSNLTAPAKNTPIASCDGSIFVSFFTYINIIITIINAANNPITVSTTKN